MTTLGKIALGIGAAIGVVTVVHVVVKSKEDKYATVNDTDKKEEEKSFKDKIKDYVFKKVEQILAFAAQHIDQIQTAGVLIGAAAGVLELIYRIKKLKDHQKLFDRLDNVEQKIDALTCLDYNNHILTAANYIGDDRYADVFKQVVNDVTFCTYTD